MERKNQIAIISETLEKHGVRFAVGTDADVGESLTVQLPITPEKTAILIFIPKGNGLQAIAPNVYKDICSKKRPRILEICNELNNRIRFLKLTLSENDINVSYDFPNNMPDEQSGEIIYEILVIFQMVFASFMDVFQKIIETETDENDMKYVSEASAVFELLAKMTELGIRFSDDGQPYFENGDELDPEENEYEETFDTYNTSDGETD